jgi:hypothetical protein
MRNARDPRRRNRKLGTPDFAWRDRGSWAPRYEIPWPGWEDRAPGERWVPQHVKERTVHGRSLRIVVERPLQAWSHACTPDDVVDVLSRLPSADVAGIGLVVLLQPARKEEQLRSVWGRLHWATEFRGYVGPAVTLSAQNLARPTLRWPRSLSPDAQEELERLRATGFAIRSGRREWVIELDLPTVRRWQRERTLPHEVGHWVDFRRRVLAHTGRENVADAVEHPDYDLLLGRWGRRPHRERERFANAYADAQTVPRP